MARKPKTVITCATAGAIHPPTMPDALPCTDDDIAASTIAAAGALLLRLRARDIETGGPSINSAEFAPFLVRIRQSINAVVNISAGRHR